MQSWKFICSNNEKQTSPSCCVVWRPQRLDMPTGGKLSHRVCVTAVKIPPNSLQKCQSGDAGWQEDSYVCVEGQKIIKWTIYRWKQFSFFVVWLKKPGKTFAVFYNLKVNWREPGAALQAWGRYLQQILNGGASTLRIAAHSCPGSRPQMAVHFWLLLWSLTGIPYLITIASVIWVQLLLSLLLSWWQPHMSSSLCFWLEFVMGPYLCVNISVAVFAGGSVCVIIDSSGAFAGVIAFAWQASI